MGLTLPVRAGFTPVTRWGGVQVSGGACTLVFLVLDLDILPETKVARHLNQQADSQTRCWWDPILLPVLLGVTLAGAMATGATAIHLQQVQHSQLSEQIHEDLGLVQQSIVTLQNELDSLTYRSLTEPQRLRPHYCGKRRNLSVFRGTMLLLCKPVRDSERKCTSIIRENQDKGEQRNHFGIQDGRAGPRG
jgi:hypothetical protein